MDRLRAALADRYRIGKPRLVAEGPFIRTFV
jgi:hypothetical protein